MWTYQAKIVRWIDGDTVDIEIDLGFHMKKRDRLRVLGINAPEKKTWSKEAGVLSQTFAEMLAPAGSEVTVRTHKADSFGRYLADITLPGGISFSEAMLKSGQAEPY
jgi:micrococcal nuclease